jgi:hypothetical protein
MGCGCETMLSVNCKALTLQGPSTVGASSIACGIGQLTDAGIFYYFQC